MGFLFASWGRKQDSSLTFLPISLFWEKGLGETHLLAQKMGFPQKYRRDSKYSRNTIRPLDFGKNRLYNARNKAREPCWYGSLALFIL